MSALRCRSRVWLALVAGLGVALVPRMGRATLGEDLVAVSVHDPEPIRLVDALHRRTMADSPAVQAVLQAVTRQPAVVTKVSSSASRAR